MVVSAINVGRQSVFARVATRSVTAVVSQGDGFGECDVQSHRPCHRCGDLGNFESVGESGALVILRKHEYLGFARQPTKGRSVKNAVAVAFETRAQPIGFLGKCAVACARGAGRQRGQSLIVVFFACET